MLFFPQLATLFMSDDWGHVTQVPVTSLWSESQRAGGVSASQPGR